MPNTYVGHLGLDGERVPRSNAPRRVPTPAPADTLRAPISTLACDKLIEQVRSHSRRNV